MYAEFTDDLKTGNKLIDSQHKELIGRINDLLVCCENGKDKEETEKILDYLTEYTMFHFDAEEALQRELNYPGYEEHKKKHEELRKTVDELHAMLDSEGNTEAFRKRVEKDVLDWLLYHINGFDRSVAEYKFMTDNPDLL